MVNRSSRIEAILSELERDSTDYVVAKQEFDAKRVRYEAARDRLAATKKLASDMMDGRQWYMWRAEHPDVKFSATAMKDAIMELLSDYAFECALKVARAEGSGGGLMLYSPFLDLDEITARLESGGFSFRSSTPAREVNAALINLHVVKEFGRYAAADKDDALLFARSVAEEERGREPVEPEDIPFE